MALFNPASIVLEGITGSTAYGRATPESKVCQGCDHDLPLNAYGVNRRFPDGLQRKCKECISTQRKNTYWRNPERYRAAVRTGKHNLARNRFKWEYRLKVAYGLTAAMWEALFRLQNGLCAICQTEAAEVVDHDHHTGAVRSLLCHKCNRGLGHFGDDPAMVKRALSYLEDARDFSSLEPTD